MATHIISMSSSAYDSNATAYAAITGTGATVEKVYKFPLTYKVEATVDQLESLTLTRDSLVDTSLTAIHSASTPTTAHLDQISINKTLSATWSPRDTSCGDGVNVYLLDTGIVATHNELSGTSINNLYTSASATGFSDTAGHGTAMASIIAGQNVGVASNCTIHNVKMFDNANGSITVGDIVDTLDEVLTHHQANSPTSAKVVCMPWVITKNQLVDDKLNELLQENLLLVAPAGNSGNTTDVDTFTPGGLDTITTVGAVDTDNYVTTYTCLPLKDQVAANYTVLRRAVHSGAKIDIWAPGGNICSADFSNVSNYVNVTGTSGASAMTAGALAHFIKLYPSATADTIKSYMVSEGFNSATTPRGDEGDAVSMLLKYDNMTFPSGKVADWEHISFSLLSVPLAADIILTDTPSGRLTNIPYGQSVTVDLGLAAGASNVSVLDFSPLSPWMSFDTSTGIFVGDTSNSAIAPANVAPGIYHFAIKGRVSGETTVEEFSVGVYNTSVTELDDATEYYYDTDSNGYEEVVQYSVAPFKY